MRECDVLLHVPGDCLGGIVEVFSGEYESPVKISGPVTVLDIGANIGGFSLWARWKWPQCSIQAYEPHPELFRILRHNTAHMDRIYRFQCAVGDTTHTRLFGREDNRLLGSLEQTPESDGGILVSVIVPSDLPNAEIIKIDTEGSEWDIVRGLSFTPSLLMVEWHAEDNRSCIDEWATVRGMMLVRSSVRMRHLGISIYARENA